MKCPTFGAAGVGWHLRGPASRWRRVYVDSISADGRMLMVRAYPRFTLLDRLAGNSSPSLLGAAQEDIPASMVVPEALVFLSSRPRKRFIPHGTVWCWRQGARELGEPWDIDPAGPWAVWPSGRLLPVS